MVGPRAASNNNVGKTRQTLYKKVFACIKEASENGFYLEAIALEESVLCDRLESIAGRDSSDSSIKKEKYMTVGKFLTTKNLQKELKEHIPESLFDKIKVWWENRNKVIHGMAKFTDVEGANWENKMNRAHICAENGIKLVREIDKISKNIHSSIKK